MLLISKRLSLISMKHLSFFLLMLTLSISVFSQQENYDKQWVLGSPTTFKTTFTSSGPVNQHWDSLNNQYFSNGHSNICTGAGELIIATDGGDIYGANRQVIDNGDSILSANAYPFLGSFGIQTTIILPLGDSIYYVFNSTWSDTASVGVSPEDVLFYHVVDMKQNGYAGKVIKKKQIAVNNVRLSASHMTAVRHGNGRDWWLVKQGIVTGGGTNKTYTFLVKQDSVLGPFIQTYSNTANGIFGAWGGQSVFNNSGTQYAAVDFARYLLTMDFDRCTGLFSNPQRLVVPWGSSLDTEATGASFSPNDSFLYVSTFESIHQWEVNNPDSATAWVYLAGADTIASYFTHYLSLRLAHDQKIYIGRVNNNGSTMSVINNPNAKGAAADFCSRCLRFPKVMNLNISVTQPPNMPNYVLGIDPKCPPNPNSVAAINNNDRFSLYPNPATNSITIENSQTSGKFELFDMAGRLLISQEISTSRTVIATGSLTDGMYIYRCSFRDKTVRNGKLLINR
jgi:hypothetical protein